MASRSGEPGSARHGEEYFYGRSSLNFGRDCFHLTVRESSVPFGLAYRAVIVTRFCRCVAL